MTKNKTPPTPVTRQEFALLDLFLEERSSKLAAVARRLYEELAALRGEIEE